MEKNKRDKKIKKSKADTKRARRKNILKKKTAEKRDQTEIRIVQKTEKAWITAVNMGYGHQRTAHPLRGLAYKGKIINANDYEGIPRRDKRIWENNRKFYEAISRFKRIPVIGVPVFSLYDDLFQKIVEFYPKKDLSQAPLLTKQTYKLIRSGWGRHFVEKIKTKNLPLITTFFIPAFMAEEFDYPGEIYLVVCDADISRQWAPEYPLSTRINYCAPNKRVVDRLKLYGVPKKQIFLTGYPLPEANIAAPRNGGIEEMTAVKADLGRRLGNLDPAGSYTEKYCGFVKSTLCALPKKTRRAFTLMFSIGGAGAQSEIGLAIMNQLAPRIKSGRIKIIVSVGISRKMKNAYRAVAKKLEIDKCENFEILFEENVKDYFNRFNKTLRVTDVLWTKPSELSFYSALGLPVIVAPPIGSQEDFNKSWLLRSGFGIEQGNLSCIGQWLDDWLDNGYLAEAAMEGFIEGEKLGVANIKNLIFGK